MQAVLETRTEHRVGNARGTIWLETRGGKIWSIGQIARHNGRPPLGNPPFFRASGNPGHDEIGANPLVIMVPILGTML